MKKVSVIERVYMVGIGLAKIIDGVVMVISLSFIQTKFSSELSARLMNCTRGMYTGMGPRQRWNKKK